MRVPPFILCYYALVFTLSLQTPLILAETTALVPLVTAQPNDSGLHLRELHISGDPSNRFDIVFFADGYTKSEENKFMDDARLLVEGIRTHESFKSVEPLLNFWAAFEPSKKSGIGIDDPGDTVFGLYRFEGEYRYLLPRYNEDVLDRIAKGKPQTDIGIIIGNDPYYGGLDGADRYFGTVTASPANSLNIIAHELGHIFTSVGEEYDNTDYFEGRNSATSTSKDQIPWAHWLSEPPAGDHVRVEKANLTLAHYPWALLEWEKPLAISFETTGEYSRYDLQFSLSGLPEKDDLCVSLDDAEIAWTPKKNIGNDRWLYHFRSNEALTAGHHTIKFELLNRERQEGTVCSVQIEEYGNEDELEDNFYGLYPTFNTKRDITYRPTNNNCLMRDLTQPKLCSVCMEGVWPFLLEGHSLIDNLTERCDGTKKIIDLQLVPLADHRKVSINRKEAYTVSWSLDGTYLSRWDNFTTLILEKDRDVAKGEWIAMVEFHTEEVRSEVDKEALRSKREINVLHPCTSGASQETGTDLDSKRWFSSRVL